MSEFDPGEHTVAEVTEYIGLNPDDADRVLQAEVAGRNRSTLAAMLSGDTTGTDSPLEGVETGVVIERPGLHNTDSVPETERFGYTPPAEAT